MIVIRFKLIVVLLVLLQAFSCDEESSQETCTGDLCPYVGNWNLTEVYVDGDKIEDDYVTYRLNLLQPDGGATTSNYTRTYANGLDEAGMWEVNNDHLILHHDEDETYIVESITQNSMTLILQRETLKLGPEEITFVFAK